MSSVPEDKSMEESNTSKKDSSIRMASKRPSTSSTPPEKKSRKESSIFSNKKGSAVRVASKRPSTSSTPEEKSREESNIFSNKKGSAVRLASKRPSTEKSTQNTKNTSIPQSDKKLSSSKDRTEPVEDTNSSKKTSSVRVAGKRPSTEKSVQSTKTRKSSHEKAQDKSVNKKSKTAKKNSSSDSPQTEKRGKKRKNPTEEKEEALPKHICAITVTRKTFQKWQPLSANTKQESVKLIDSIIPIVLNSVSEDNQTMEQIQNNLSMLRRRIVSKLDEVKGPSQKADDKKSEFHCRILQESLISANNQLEFLDEKLKEEERHLEEEQRELEEYEIVIETFNEEKAQNEAKLHPLLKGTPINSLNIPESLASLHHSTKGSPDIGQENKRLVVSLTKICDQASALGFQRWSEKFQKLNINSLKSTSN